MNTQTSLAQIVTDNPKAAEVFVRYGLDFCCHGQRSLEEACREDHLDPKALLHELSTIKGGAAGAAHWEERGTEELIDFIVDRYHKPLRVELPFLIELARKVERTHKGLPGCPTGLTEHLEKMQKAVLGHLAKEEQLLFPMLLAGNSKMAERPINVMTQEHEEHGESLHKIREATHDLSLPADHCTSWKQLYIELRRLETELMEHIHLENYVLFPRALRAFEGAKE